MKSRSLVSFFVIPLAVLAMAPTAQANTAWYVNGVSGSDSNNCTSALSACKTIGHAISQALSGDSIIVAAATYTENLYIGFSLNLIGSGANTTIIDGGHAGRVVTITNSVFVRISHLTIRNGYTVSQSPINPGVVIYGGGIYNSGSLTIDNSTVTANVTQCIGGFVCASWGGGIYNAGTLTITNSTVAGNSANGHSASQGGGIYNRGGLTIDNSTVSSNSANQGGGVYDYNSIGKLRIDNSTISGNSANQGGGIGACCFTSDGSETLQNSIIANSVLYGGNCFGGGITSLGYNLSSDKTCNFNSAGDLNNIDPKLGPLQNNGGLTQTQAVLPGSPAIDAGNPSGCTNGQGQLLTTDQRGMPRHDPEDTRGCDIGAYESQSD